MRIAIQMTTEDKQTDTGGTQLPPFGGRIILKFQIVFRIQETLV